MYSKKKKKGFYLEINRDKLRRRNLSRLWATYEIRSSRSRKRVKQDADGKQTLREIALT